MELEKLPLKRDALKKLNLPIDIKSGECIYCLGEMYGVVVLMKTCGPGINLP